MFGNNIKMGEKEQGREGMTEKMDEIDKEEEIDTQTVNRIEIKSDGIGQRKRQRVKEHCEGQTIFSAPYELAKG